MNPLYQMFNQGQQAPAMNTSMNPQAMNPLQKMQYMMQAMTNPAAFVKQHFPDIPAQIQNNPTQILQYLQQTRNISNEQIQNLVNQYPRPF